MCQVARMEDMKWHHDLKDQNAIKETLAIIARMCNCDIRRILNEDFEESICASIMLDMLLQEWKLNITFSSSLLGVVICTYKTIADSNQFHEKTKIIKR